MSRFKQFVLKMISIVRNLFAYPSSEVAEKINDEYWQKKLGEHIGCLSPFRLERAQRVAGLVDNGSFVIDLGAGDGAVLEYLVKEKNITALAVENSSRMIERLQKLLFQVRDYDLGDCRQVELLPEADYYLALEVLEHLPYPEKLLKLSVNKAKKGFVFSIPNSGYFVHRLRLLFGRFPLQWIAHPGEHLRFWTAADLRWWLKAQGFSDFRIIFYQGIPVLKQLWPALFAEGIIVIVRCSR